MASTFACVSITPFGSAVDPEVYCRRASDSGEPTAGRHASARPSGTVSVAMHAMLPADATASVAARNDDVVSTAAGSRVTRDRAEPGKLAIDAAAPRRVGWHGDDAGEEAPEERLHELQPAREEQERAFSAELALLESCVRGARARRS